MFLRGFQVPDLVDENERLRFKPESGLITQAGPPEGSRGAAMAPPATSWGVQAIY